MFTSCMKSVGSSLVVYFFFYLHYRKVREIHVRKCSTLIHINNTGRLNSSLLSAPLSPVAPCDRRDHLKRPQYLSLDYSSVRPSFHFSSPSTGSPQSPQSPLPWDSAPTHKVQHSYMNPTASSMAKRSRSSSMGEGLPVGSPPRSPCFLERTSYLELDTGSPLLASSPVTSLPSSLSKCPSPTLHLHTTALVNPQTVPPSRIPLPRQPLSPRRSLVLEVKPSSSRAFTPIADSASDASLGNKQG